MSQSSDLGSVREVRLSSGNILRYRERGSGKPIVFVHGLLVNGDLWRKVVPRLSDRYRCITPDLPLGSHEIPFEGDADLSVPAVARVITDFLEALDLTDVTIVANDTGGALTQVAVTERPERVGRVVLTPCDAYDIFPPALFKPLTALSRFPTLLYLTVLPLRWRPLQRLPIAFGWLAKRPIETRFQDGYLSPFFTNPDIRRDCAKVLRGISPEHTLRAADRLRAFDRPVLLAWASEDRLFPPEYARRLAADIPRSEIEWIADSYTFVSEDRPEDLVKAVEGFIGRTSRGKGAVVAELAARAH